MSFSFSIVKKCIFPNTDFTSIFLLDSSAEMKEAAGCGPTINAPQGK